MDILQTKSFLLIIAAVGYAAATVGMKLSASQIGPLGIALLVAGFLAAAVSEVTLLREASLGVLYLLIIAVETLLVLTYAYVIGEGLSRSQFAGGALVMVGVAMLSH